METTTEEKPMPIDKTQTELVNKKKTKSGKKKRPDRVRFYITNEPVILSFK